MSGPLVQFGVPQGSGWGPADHSHVESLRSWRGGGETWAHPICPAVAHRLDVLKESKLVGKEDRKGGGAAGGCLLPMGLSRSSKRSHVDDGMHIGASERRFRPVGDYRGREDGEGAPRPGSVLNCCHCVWGWGEQGSGGGGRGSRNCSKGGRFPSRLEDLRERRGPGCVGAQRVIQDKGMNGWMALSEGEEGGKV